VAKLYDFLWDEFCDWYIEFAKIRMQGADEEVAQNTRRVLVYVMSNTLKLLHPFMPFITEEIWQSLPHEGESIMVSEWPKEQEALRFDADEAKMDAVMAAIRTVRNRRSEMNVPPSKKAHLYIATAEADVFEENLPLMERLAYASSVILGDSFDMPGAVTMVTRNAKLYIPMDELVDKKAERARLQKERDSVQKQLMQCENKLNNAGFMKKAPANVVEGVRKNAETLRKKMALIDESLQAL
jgi:valyl-tRNA synthetase